MTTILSDTETRVDDRESDQNERQSSPGGDTALEHSSAQSTHAATICVVGLGYVGLPLAVGFARSNYRVIGYDVDDVTVGRLQEGIDTTGDLSDDAIQDGDISYTTDASEIGAADYVIIAVPTPIDDDDRPDLGYVESAASTVGSTMDPGTTVVLESTVYPGTTRETVVPALEDASGLTAGTDFFVGYSPERATPGDADHGLEDVVKVVSAQTEAVLEDVATLYESIVDAGVHRAPSIEVAEACKVVENAQRDLNIAFVNELTMRSTPWTSTAGPSSTPRARSGTSTTTGRGWSAATAYRSIRTSSRTGRLRRVRPRTHANGPAGQRVGPRPRRRADDQALNQCHKTLRESRVLVLGLAYKPDVGDIRSSKIGTVIDELQEYDIDVEGFDPFADDEAARESFGIEIQDRLSFEASTPSCSRRPTRSSTTSISRRLRTNSPTNPH